VRQEVQDRTKEAQMAMKLEIEKLIKVIKGPQ
jgi:hypothetical protein